MATSSSYRVAPSDQRCVWMTAGVLTYQLCDRKFECTGCPLDAAMRNACVRPESDLRSSRDRRPLRADRFYTAEHCWISEHTSGSVRIGLEPGFAIRLASAHGISPPPAGRVIHEREACVWCRFEDAMVPIRLPFDVTVVDSNRDVRSQPSLVAEDPFEKGWLLDAIIDRTKLKGRCVMDAHEAEKVYANDEEELRIIEAAFVRSGASGVGPTMHDGGEHVQFLVEMLGSARYCALIGRVYCKVT